LVLVGFVAILSDIFIRSHLWGGRRNDNGKAGGILVIVGLVFLILSPIFTRLIHLAISRKREFLADASGALLTRYPEGLASALQKISKAGIPMKRQSKAISHMYISNPLGSVGRKVSGLFMTHPPVEERIKALVGERRM
jgi:heat shock protein HtpX